MVAVPFALLKSSKVTATVKRTHGKAYLFAYAYYANFLRLSFLVHNRTLAKTTSARCSKGVDDHTYMPCACVPDAHVLSLMNKLTAGLTAFCKPSVGLFVVNPVAESTRLEIKSYGPCGAEIRRNFIREW